MTYQPLMFERLQILELPLCGVGALRVGLVKDLGGADAAAVVDVGRQVEAAATQLGHEVDLLGGLRLGLKQTDAMLYGSRNTEARKIENWKTE